MYAYFQGISINKLKMAKLVFYPSMINCQPKSLSQILMPSSTLQLYPNKEIPGNFVSIFTVDQIAKVYIIPIKLVVKAAM